MFRFITILLLLLISLLAVLPAPFYALWLVSVAVQELGWVFAGVVLLLLLTGAYKGKYGLVNSIACALAIVLFISPAIRAYGVSKGLGKRIQRAFVPPDSGKVVIDSASAFRWWRMFTFGAPVIALRTVSYDTAGGSPLTLDLYPAQRPGSRPCVIVIHGGAWSGGDSRQLPELNSRLADEGFVVAAINYRLAPGHKSPAPVEDVAKVFDFLRHHAADLSIDSTAFVLLGRSAGAQVALLAAYTLEEPGLRGVIDFYGPADSPIEHVTPFSVPTLMIHGEKDVMVAYEHSKRLNKKLADSGVRHYLVTLPWATHGFDYTLNGPGGQLSTYAVERFLQEVTP
jgi:acetyl esterase/lipase